MAPTAPPAAQDVPGPADHRPRRWSSRSPSSLVSVLVINRLDDYFTRQQAADLGERHKTVIAFIRSITLDTAGGAPVVDPTGALNPLVVARLEQEGFRNLIADRTAQADVIIRFGTTVTNGDLTAFVPAPEGTIRLPLEAPPARGQTRERMQVHRLLRRRPASGHATRSRSPSPTRIPTGRPRSPMSAGCSSPSPCSRSGWRSSSSAGVGASLHDATAPVDRCLAGPGRG